MKGQATRGNRTRPTRFVGRKELSIPVGAFFLAQAHRSCLQAFSLEPLYKNCSILCVEGCNKASTQLVPAKMLKGSNVADTACLKDSTKAGGSQEQGLKGLARQQDLVHCTKSQRRIPLLVALYTARTPDPIIVLNLPVKPVSRCTLKCSAVDLSPLQHTRLHYTWLHRKARIQHLSHTSSYIG